MLSYWLSATNLLISVAVFALLIAVFSSANVGLMVAGGSYLLIALFQLYYLQRLQQWLKDPEANELPEGRGRWREVFAALYRARRREEKNRGRITAALDRFIQASQALPDGVVLLDAKNRIEWCNTMAQQQFGLDITRDRGILITNLVRQPEFSGYLAKTAHTEALEMHTVGLLPQPLSIQVIPFADTSKLLISRDIAAIERADTIRRDFVANVSHELRTPLTVINGFLEHLISGALAQESATAQLQLMREQAGRMARIVEDLLMLSRLEAADNPSRVDTVRMSRLVQELVEEGKSLSRNRHQITVSAASADLLGSIDELRSAFSNLLSNAIRYTPEGGCIGIHWEVDDQCARFSVTDTGIGVAPEHIPRLTERFYRVDRGRSRETGGTGLGLAIVKHVLLRHQATLEISSEIGKGSRFCCVFPLARVRGVEAGQAVGLG